LAHRASPALPEDHVRREAGRALADGLEDTGIKLKLFLGGDKMVNGGFREVLLLQAVFLAADPGK
jgi:hypothetical protein